MSWADDTGERVEKPATKAHTEDVEWIPRFRVMLDLGIEKVWVTALELPLDAVLCVHCGWELVGWSAGRTPPTAYYVFFGVGRCARSK